MEDNNIFNADKNIIHCGDYCNTYCNNIVLGGEYDNKHICINSWLTWALAIFYTDRVFCLWL